MIGEAALFTKTAAAALLERVLGRWFSVSHASRKRLGALVGRSIAVCLDPPGLTIYLFPTPEGLQIHTESDGVPDVTLSGSLPAFARVGLGRSPHQALRAGELRIDGETEVADALRRLFADAADAWRERLTTWVGPIAAGHAAGVADAARTWAERTGATVRDDVTEFLQEEVREMPAPAEGEAFLSDVDRLREDCDRLEARLGRLRATLAPPPQD